MTPKQKYTEAKDFFIGFMNEFNFTETKENTFTLETEHNKLTLSLKDYDKALKGFTVFGRFEKPNNVLGNTYSGKYNLHEDLSHLTDLLYNIEAYIMGIKQYLFNGVIIYN